jgi:hypothetical protein
MAYCILSEKYHQVIMAYVEELSRCLDCNIMLKTQQLREDYVVTMVTEESGRWSSGEGSIFVFCIRANLFVTNCMLPAIPPTPHMPSYCAYTVLFVA